MQRTFRGNSAILLPARGLTRREMVPSARTREHSTRLARSNFGVRHGNSVVSYAGILISGAIEYWDTTRFCGQSRPIGLGNRASLPTGQVTLWRFPVATMRQDASPPKPEDTAGIWARLPPSGTRGRLSGGTSERVQSMPAALRGRPGGSPVPRGPD